MISNEINEIEPAIMDECAHIDSALGEIRHQIELLYTFRNRRIGDEIQADGKRHSYLGMLNCAVGIIERAMNDIRRHEERLGSGVYQTLTSKGDEHERSR